MNWRLNYSQHRYRNSHNKSKTFKCFIIRSNDAHFNPLVPSAHKSARIVKILILNIEGTIQKISNERRDYGSVDEKSLS